MTEENWLLDVYKRQAVMKSDLPFGKYYVKEIATDEHYVLSDTKYPVVFEYAGQRSEERRVGKEC